MSRMAAASLLLWRFAVSVAGSAVATGRLILSGSGVPRRGFVRLPYGDLSDTGAGVLATLITLTPGSSTVDIDLERGELLLHVLDRDDFEAARPSLQRAFMEPIHTLFGGRR